MALNEIPSLVFSRVEVEAMAHMDSENVQGDQKIAVTPQFDWDEHNIGHIAEHLVTPDEAEQVLLNDPVDLGFQLEEGDEERWPYIGETNAGRTLRVVVTLRGERLRVVTAFEPSRRNKQDYLAIRAGQYDRFESS